MSSDGTFSSSGSRIRQFGLYSNIDARTEEFLRLSRKRQIRQGCACAAASTAITVTIAIVVFLVYEFSLNSETNVGNSSKSNWLSLMNNTPENTSFDSKLTKANIDKTTLQLLPLLIKAIKKNAFLEKLLEEHLSSSSPYSKKETKELTENYLQPNIFSNTWLKIPTTKLYAIEYKTSPVVYFKHPTKNIEHYTKIRKIRDYQRVFNYVDKMINEKVNIRSTRPVIEEKTRTETPAINKQIMHKTNSHHKPIQAKLVTSKTVKNNKTEKAPFRCKCSEKIGNLLSKILFSIQKLLQKTNSESTTVLKCVQSLPINNVTIVKSPPFNISSLITTFKPVTSTVTERVTRYLDNNTQNFRTLTFEPKTVTEAFKDFNMVSPSTVKLNEQTTLKTENYTQSRDLQITPPTTRKPIKFVNTYKNIINRKQILRNPELRFTNTVYEPIFDGIEYDDYSYITPASMNTSILNNNKIDFIETKLKYLNDVKREIKNINNKFKIPEIYKKIDRTIFKPRKSTMKDINVVDNKIALVKTKLLKTNKVSKKSKQNYTNVVTENFKKIVEDKSKLDVFNSSQAIGISTKIPIEVLIKFNGTDLPDVQETTHIPLTSYFNHLKKPEVSETIYQSVKNVNRTYFSSNNIVTPKPDLFKITLINTKSDEQRNREIELLKNKSRKNIYQMIKNGFKELLNQEQIYPKNQNTSLSFPILSTSGINKERKSNDTELSENKYELLFGALPEITKNTIFETENKSIHERENITEKYHELLFGDFAENTKNNTDETENNPKGEQENITENKSANYLYPLRNEDYVFTWEDLTNDIFTTWRSTTTKRKYLKIPKD